MNLKCLAEDIPVFPVYEKMLVAVRQRVNLARQLDKLELQARRTNSECGWLQKAANDMDIILDEDELYPLHIYISPPFL